jgi:hypothetical protein
MDTVSSAARQQPLEVGAPPPSEGFPAPALIGIYAGSIIVWGGGLVWFTRDDRSATELPRWEVLIIGASGLGWAAWLIWISRGEEARERVELGGHRLRWQTALVNVLQLVLATVFLTVSLGALAELLATFDVPLSTAGADVVAVGTVYRHLVWEVLAALPVVDLPETLGWERPVTDPASGLGLPAVLLRSAFVLVVLGLMVRWVRQLRQAVMRDPTTARGDEAREPSA